MSHFCVCACVRILLLHARLRRDVVRAPRVSLRRKRVSSTHDEAVEKIGLLQREKSRLARVAREESKRRQRPIRFAQSESTSAARLGQIERSMEMHMWPVQPTLEELVLVLFHSKAAMTIDPLREERETRKETSTYDNPISLY